MCSIIMLDASHDKSYASQKYQLYENQFGNLLEYFVAQSDQIIFPDTPYIQQTKFYIDFLGWERKDTCQ